MDSSANLGYGRLHSGSDRSTSRRLRPVADGATAGRTAPIGSELAPAIMLAAINFMNVVQNTCRGDDGLLEENYVLDMFLRVR
jgi:hypothetical protein